MNEFLFIIFSILFIIIAYLSSCYICTQKKWLLIPIILLLIITFKWGHFYGNDFSLAKHYMWFCCFILILIMIVLLLVYRENKSKRWLFTFVLILIFWGYSFCNEKGSVRLAIAIKGHPEVAYATNLLENTYMRTHNTTYYVSSTLIKEQYTTLSFFRCESYGILKISEYDK